MLREKARHLLQECIPLRLGAAEDPAGAPAYHIPEEL